MSRAIAIAAVVLTMCAGQSPVTFAQTGLRASQEWEWSPGSQVVKGKIPAEKGRWIVFANGTQVAVPDNLVQHFEMKPGAFIRAMYEEREGQKFATAIELREPVGNPE